MSESMTHDSRGIGQIGKPANLIPRYLYILQAVAGAVLLIVAYMMGHVHFRLIQQGVRAPGTVVGFQYKNIGNNTASRTSDPAFMPIVEFHAGERIVRFQDWKGSASRDGSDRADPFCVLPWRSHASVFSLRGLYLTGPSASLSRHSSLFPCECRCGQLTQPGCGRRFGSP
jgi:hypothetical protein